MKFSEVIGQSTPKHIFRQMIQLDRMPHALMLLAAPGSGGLALALALAQYLLCTDKTTEGDACGQCAHCRKASKLIHPDLHFSFPFVGSKMTADNFLVQWRQALLDNPYLEVNDWLQIIGAENKQGNINKEECVNIMQKLQLKSFESERKVMILWLPEYLGNEGNRLLKLIEEPPGLTNFILVAENQERILNTILSRCQLVKVNALSDEEISQALIEKQAWPAEKAESLAALAEGNYNEALKMGDEQDSDLAQLFLDWMRKVYKGHPVELVTWVNSFSELGRENQKHFIKYALHFWRAFIIYKAMGEAYVRLRDKEKQTAINMAKVITIEQAEAIVNELNQASLHVERNAHPKVLFLDVSIQMNHIIKRWSSYQVQRQNDVLATMV